MKTFKSTDKPASIGNLSGWATLLINGFMFTTMITNFNSHPSYLFYRAAIICFIAGGFFSFLSLLITKFSKSFLILSIIFVLLGGFCLIHDFLIESKFIKGKAMSLVIPTPQNS
jgi:hypothetical protein